MHSLNDGVAHRLTAPERASEIDRLGALARYFISWYVFTVVREYRADDRLYAAGRRWGQVR